MKLYELGSAIRALIDRADDDGVLAEEVVAELDKLEGELDYKAESVALAIKEIEAEAESVAKEATRLGERRKSIEARAERLREYLAYWLAGRTVKGRLVSIFWRKSVAVEITDEAALLDRFWRVKREPDKAAIKDALVNGREKVPGAQLVERSHLSLR